MIIKPKLNSLIKATLKNGDDIYLRYELAYDSIKGKYKKTFNIIFKYQCDVSSVKSCQIKKWQYIIKNGKLMDVKLQNEYLTFKKEYLSPRNVKNWKFYKEILLDPDCPEEQSILNKWNRLFTRQEFLDYLDANVTDWEFDKGVATNPLRLLWFIYRMGYRDAENNSKYVEEHNTEKPKKKSYRKYKK